MGPRTGLDGRKISSPLGFDTRPSSPVSVAIPTELPGPLNDNSNLTIAFCPVNTQRQLSMLYHR